MSDYRVSQPQVDPFFRTRIAVCYGLDSKAEGAIALRARVVPLVSGLSVSDSSLASVSSIVVGIGISGRASSAHLGSPAKTEQLLGLIDLMKRSARFGIERIVIEQMAPHEPHSGLLGEVCDTHIRLSGTSGQLRSTAAQSALSRDLISLFLARDGGINV